MLCVSHPILSDIQTDNYLRKSDFFLQAHLNVSLPGLPREVAQSLVDAAHQTCPYFKATCGNIDVAVNLA